MDDFKTILSEKEMPDKWYNVIADLPFPIPPVLHPGTLQPVGPADLAPLFPMELIKQEVSAEREISIPGEIMDILKLWRPTPLSRAYRLEKMLGTPARIYYKNESVSPTGSHKPNTAVAQAYYNKKEGVKRLTTETGAGQWGSALSFACNVFGLGCRVYMVKVSYQQKPFRKSLMHTFGAEVIPSPSTVTECGRKMLADNPDSPGSLGMAISEAVEEAAKNNEAKYSLGSVLNHVMLHQTIIGQEVKLALEKNGVYPDVLIACVGGGSNFAGFTFPFVADKISGRKKDLKILAVEPHSCPSLTKGLYRFDFGDTARLTPLVKMFTLGHDFVPPGIHAGGLRYHGMSPLVSLLHSNKVIDAVAYHQLEVFQAAITFAKAEGIIPAPETAHAIKGVIDEALKAKVEGKAKTIVFNFSGHGYFDLAAYDKYYDGQLEDYEYPEELVRKAEANIPNVPNF